MAVRTTASEVSKIVKVKTGDDLTPFIEAANNVVTQHCTDAAFTTEQLELIERWLSSHFYLVYRPVGMIERAGPVSKQIESRVDLGFDVTRHGQMAMRLDWSGALSALNEQAKNGAQITTGVTWLGTPHDEEDDE